MDGGVIMRKERIKSIKCTKVNLGKCKGWLLVIDSEDSSFQTWFVEKDLTFLDVATGLKSLAKVIEEDGEHG